MLTRIFKTLLLIAIFGESAARASVSIAFEAGNINTASGNKVALGTVGVIVVDTGSAGFAFNSAATYSNIVGATLNAGNLIGGDTILGVFQATDADVDGLSPVDRVFSGSLLSGANYGSGLLTGISAGQNLALYWFPGVTTIGATLTGSQSEAGFFRQTANSVVSNSDIGYVLPTDGASYNLFSYGSDLTGLGSGSISPSSFNAFSLSPIPEPSRVVLLAVGALGVGLRRRRNLSQRR